MKKDILKKQILLIFSFVCFSLILYGIMNISDKQKDIQKVNALPISNKTIVIDAGHGIPDERCKRILWNN